VVGVDKSGKDLLGYNVYLNDIQIGFTTDTTYQIPQNLCTYGQTYTACVEAAYECGISTIAAIPSRHITCLNQRTYSNSNSRCRLSRLG
jgi:hypothetical protein